MKINNIFKTITIFAVILSTVILQTGCTSQNKGIKNKQVSVYQQSGASYKNKYYYVSDEIFAFKVFDEKAKKSEFICKKENCKHEEKDKSCASYVLNSQGYVVTDNYLFIFCHGDNENEIDYINRVDLNTGEKEKYANTGYNYYFIYNAFLIDNIIYYSVQFEQGGCSIKAFDIDKKTVTNIANEKDSKDIFAYICGVEDDVIYYREDYHEKDNYDENTMFYGIDTEYTMIGWPNWYNNYIGKTMLFTFNINTNKKVNTVKNIDFYTYTYYNKNLYYTDINNKKAYKMDWITGKEELLFTNDKQLYLHAVTGFDNKLSFNEYIDKKIYSIKNDRYVTGMILYDLDENKHKKHLFNNDQIYSMSRIQKCKDGFIVDVVFKPNRTVKYAYISQDDYYNGIANFLYFE